MPEKNTTYSYDTNTIIQLKTEMGGDLYKSNKI